MAKGNASLRGRALLANGTTCLYFATVHQGATRLLADIGLDKGQRAVIGKVVIDDPGSCPDYYRDASTEAALKGTVDFINYVGAHPDNEGTAQRLAVERTPAAPYAGMDVIVIRTFGEDREAGSRPPRHIADYTPAVIIPPLVR